MNQSKKALYGLVGFPVKHSLSPAMHNAAFCACGIPAEYKLFEVEPQNLESFLEGLPASGIVGCNVTVPHKIKVRDFIAEKGELTGDAEKIAAVNTIIVRDSKLIGDNTDGKGFMESLTRDLDFDPKGKTICMIGAGGAARAIIMQLGDLPDKIYLLDIDEAPLEGLKSNYKKYYPDQPIESRLVKNKQEASEFVKQCDLFINATPIGMKGKEGCVIETSALGTNTVVFDAVYNPAQSQLIKLARGKGLKATNGIGMLLYQGVFAFQLWTKTKAPVKVMKEALEEELKKC